jgi:hypothetical protein
VSAKPILAQDRSTLHGWLVGALCGRQLWCFYIFTAFSCRVGAGVTSAARELAGGGPRGAGPSGSDCASSGERVVEDIDLGHMYECHRAYA